MASFWFSILLGLVLLINSECSLTDHLEIFVNKTGHVTISGERVQRFPFIGAIRNNNFGMSHERNQDCINKHFEPKCKVHNVFFTKEESEDFRKMYPNLTSSTLLILLTGTKTVTSYETFGEAIYAECNNYNDYPSKCITTKSIAVTDTILATSSHSFEFGAETKLMIGFHFVGASELEVKLAGKYSYGSAHQVSNSKTKTISNTVETLVSPQSTVTVIYKPKYYHTSVDIFFKYMFDGFVVTSYKEPCNGHYYHAHTLSEFMKVCYTELNDTLTDTYKITSHEGITSSVYSSKLNTTILKSN